MNEFVLDAYALLSLLQKEPGYGRVETVLKGAKNGEMKAHVSAFNIAEVQCMVLRRGTDSARILAALEALPLTIASADSYMFAAAEIKAKYGMSMGGAFAAALAQDLDKHLISGDREYRKMGSVLSVEWMR